MVKHLMLKNSVILSSTSCFNDLPLIWALTKSFCQSRGTPSLVQEYILCVLWDLAEMTTCRVSQNLLEIPPTPPPQTKNKKKTLELFSSESNN